MKLIHRKSIMTITLVLIGLLAAASFFDYPLSLALYDPKNWFGLVFAAYGQMPAMICLAAGGILLILQSKRKVSFSVLIGILLQIFAFLKLMTDPLKYISQMPMFLSFGIAAIFMVIADFGIYHLSEQADSKDIKKFTILLLGVALTEMLVIMGLKIPWARPRMRMIMVQGEEFFQPWWIIGNTMKEQLMSMGVAAEEFKSFPSGHTGNAACMVLLGFLPLLNAKLLGKEKALFTIGFIFTFATALSRIIMGAHFLSDVVIGMSLTLIIIGIYAAVLWRTKE